MKKRNRLLAGFLALVLVMTSIVWDFGSVNVTNAEETSAIKTTDDSLSIDFDNINVTELDAAGYTSTRFKNSVALVGEVNRKVSEHWFSGNGDDTPYGTGNGTNATGKNVGLKSNDVTENENRTVMYTDCSYEDFTVSADIYYGAYSGIVIGEKNVYPTANGETSSVAVFFNAGRLHIVGAVDATSIKMMRGKATAVSQQNTGHQVFNNGGGNTIAAHAGTAYTVNVKKTGNTLIVWYSGGNGLVTIKLNDSFKTGVIGIQSRAYDGDNGGFKSLNIEKVHATETHNLDNADFTELDNLGYSASMGSTSVATTTNNNTTMHNSVGDAFFSGTSGYAYNSTSTTVTSANEGIKGRATNSSIAALNIPYVYENFRLEAEVYHGQLIGVAIGDDASAPRSSGLFTVFYNSTYNNNVMLQMENSYSSPVRVGGLSGSNSSQFRPASGGQGIANTKEIVYTLVLEVRDGVATVWMKGYEGYVKATLTTTVEKIALIARNPSSDKGGIKGYTITNLDAGDTQEFDDVVLSNLDAAGYTARADGTSTLTTVSKSGLWFSGDSTNYSSTEKNKNKGIKPSNTDTTREILNIPHSYENFRLETELYHGQVLGVKIGLEAKGTQVSGGTATSGSVSLYINGENLAICGAIDHATAELNGASTSVNTSGYMQYKPTGNSAKWNQARTLIIEVQDGILSVAFGDLNHTFKVKLHSSYEAESIAFFARRYDTSGGNAGGGFKGYTIEKLPTANTGTTVDVAGYTDFDHVDVDALTNRGFTSTRLNRNDNYAIVGEPNQVVKNHWFAGNGSIPSYTNVNKVTAGNIGLKPNQTDGDKTVTLLNAPTIYPNYRATLEVYWGAFTGLVLGEKNIYPTSRESDTAVTVYFNGNRTQIVGGGVDFTTALLRGGDGKSSIYEEETYFFTPSESFVATKAATYKLNVEVLDGVLSIWVDGYESVFQIVLSDTFKNENIAILARKYDGDGGGIKSFEITEIASRPNTNTGTNVDVSGYTDFDKVDVTALDAKGFTATQFDTNNDYAVVSADQSVSTYWFAGEVGKDSDGKGAISDNDGLKPLTTEADKKMTVLNTPYVYDNFRISTQVYWGSNAGIILGAKNVFPASETDSSVRIYFNANQLQIVGGGLNYDLKSTVGESTCNKVSDNFYIYKPSSDYTGEAGQIYTLNVEALDGVLTIWVDGCDGKVSIKLADTFKNESIALVGRNYNGDGGGFKSLTVKEIDPEARDSKQALPGDGFSEAFAPSDEVFKTTDLDEDFSSHYFASDDADSVRDRVSFRWNDTNTGLKPKHDRASKAYTLLTYDKLIFKNVEISAKYQRSWGEYAIVIAPEGEMATVENHGIKVWVESEGRIRVTGAIDAGTASAVGGYVTVLGQNMIAGYNISDYANKATDKFYHLHAKIEGSVLTVWIDEFPEYIISVNVTEDYQGGFVSLSSNGNNDGGYASFTATELEEATPVSRVYSQSFNTIDSLDELKDFTAYSLDSVKNKMKEADINEIFRLREGKLQATSAENGKNDKTNFSILTLNNKKYTNFELTLKYEQHRMQRYGVAFGTELGEFAYTQKGSRLAGNGGAYVYTEAEGYRNVRGSLYASCYTDPLNAQHRDKGEENLPSFWWYNNDEMNNVQRRTVHTMTIRVVGEYMTMVIDNDESSRVTVRLDDYKGGYISLVSDAAANDFGAFLHLSVKELDKDAKLETGTPEVSDGYETIGTVKDMFDAYYLADATVTNQMEQVDLESRWYLNKGGILTRNVRYGEDITWKYAETKDVDVLTYKKQAYTDFELTYTYQQTARRLGIVIGGDKGVYPLSWKDDKIVADKGAIVYVETEGYSNVKGHVNNMTDKDNSLYRITTTAPDGFKDVNGQTIPYEGTLHTVKVVVKDKQLYVFIDGNTEPSLYVHLGDNYTGGYVSLFAHANSWHGFKNFTITDKITTELTKGGGTSVSGNTVVADFDTAKFDDSMFKTYYLAKTKGNADGSMEEQNFEDQWTIHSGRLNSNNTLTSPSSKNMEEFEYDDSTMVSVLTYNKKMTDFVVTYDYQKTPQRMMFMFGTEMGKFALAAPNTTQKGQGVLLYPENDLGAGGGLVALGNLATYNSSMRPSNRAKVTLDDYHIKGEWASNVGTWHTMTVAVINGHCYVYLDDYGMIADYELIDYEGGYISLATTGRSGGFDNLKITDLETLSENDIIAAENPNDITVLVGTELSAIGLPTSVKATTKAGQTVDVPVTWKSLNYNASEVGVYQFTALLDEKTYVGARIQIRVVEEMPKTQAGVKYWTFDTEDDLKDFKAYYLKNVDSGYLTEGVPNWYVSSSGKLTRDAFRAVNGDQYKELAILTYAGEKYTNFEMEVEYTQQWQRMMVMFGSEKVGQYIDLKDIYAEKNPVAGFVEMEGVRNFIGNLINANFDSNDKEKINNAREGGVRLENYYDKVLSGGNQGKKHTMKIRVVGDQAMMWVDDAKDPYVCTLTNYDGGYISLVTCAKSGSYDNLKITRLNAKGEPVAEETEAVANGEMGVTIDGAASTELVVPSREKPEGYEDIFLGENQEWSIPPVAYIVGGTTIALAAVAGGLIILTALKKKKKEN